MSRCVVGAPATHPVALEARQFGIGPGAKGALPSGAVCWTMAIGPLSPTAVHCDERATLVQVTATSSSPPRARPPTVAQLFPFQVSVSVPAAPSPTAVHRSGAVHDSPYNSEGLWGAAGFRTTDQRDPSNSSVRAAILKRFDPTLPSAPTVMHVLGVVHQTPLRTSRFLPTRGAGMTVHCLPFHDRMSGFSTKLLGPLPVTTAPTAMQNRGDTHDTLPAEAGPAPGGLLIADQLVPFQDTSRGVELVDDEEVTAPTPTQNLVEVHETPTSDPFVAERTLRMTDHLLPSHRS